MRNKGRGALWVGGVLVYVFVLASVRGVTGGATGTVLAWVLGALAGTLLWWWTARLMLRGEVRWRPLLPTAALTALGTSFYAMAADMCGCRSRSPGTSRCSARSASRCLS